MTLAAAQDLKYGQTVFHAYARGADGSPLRWRVLAKPQVHKRDPEYVLVRLRHGLHDEHLMDRWSIALFEVTEAEALARQLGAIPC